MSVRNAIRCLVMTLPLQWTAASHAQVGDADPSGQSMREIAEEVLTRIGAIPGSDTPACSTCHALNIGNLSSWSHSDVRWGCLNGAQTADDINSWDQQKALDAVRCISMDPQSDELRFHPRKLGLVAAGVEHLPFRAIFAKAFNQSEAVYQNFLSAVQMPPGGHNKLTENEFRKMMRWSDDGAPFLTEILGNTPFPTSCETQVADEFRQHILATELSGWQARNRENGIMMFACSDNNPLTCFTQKKADGSDVFANAVTTPTGAGWDRDHASTFRILYRLEHETSYWMRTSADGRFVGNGKNSGNDGYNGMIDDMMGLLEPEGRTRPIEIQAYFDPSFFVDNSGFLFQGGGTGICSQRVLEDTSITRIDWTQPGCTKESSHRVSLYQSVGTSLDSGDLLTVTGNFESDHGSSSYRGEPFNSVSSAYIQKLAHDGSQYRTVGSKSVEMPFQGDFALSPSGKLLIGRLTGATDNYQQIALGYKFYKMTATGSGTSLRVDAREIATVCEGGRKGVMSFDERFWTFYKPVEAKDWQDFGYASAEDPEFRALVGNSSNIYVTDFLTGTTHRVTRMQPGQYAQFPHFRSDNWLVFMVGGTPHQYVVASDAAIRLKGL